MHMIYDLDVFLLYMSVEKLKHWLIILMYIF